MDPNSPEAERAWMLDGATCDPEAAVLTVQDGSAFTGCGVFETIPLYQDRPFFLGEHWSRLQDGASRLGLACPGQDELASQLALLANRTGAADRPVSRARVTLLRPDLPDAETRTLLEVGPPPVHRSTARVISLPFARNEKGALAGCKTLNYGENAVARALVRERGADDALFPNTSGDLCEGVWSNCFVRLDGFWRTPSLESGCLPGVTRARLLEIAASIGVEIREEAIPVARLDEVEAAFSTSSMREIQPIESIDGRLLPAGEAAQEIERLREAWRELVRSHGAD